MRIDSSNIPDVAQQRTAERATESKGDHGGPDKAASRSAVVVSIGTAAGGAARAAGQLSDDVRARLEQVREQLLTDDYPIDFDLLAERMVDDEIARLGGR